MVGVYTYVQHVLPSYLVQLTSAYNCKHIILYNYHIKYDILNIETKKHVTIARSDFVNFRTGVILANLTTISLRQNDSRKQGFCFRFRNSILC